MIENIKNAKESVIDFLDNLWHFLVYASMFGLGTYEAIKAKQELAHIGTQVVLLAAGAVLIITGGIKLFVFFAKKGK